MKILANLVADKIGEAIAAYCASRPGAGHLTSQQLSAVTAPVAVGIGIIVAYLVLDRFRYHTKIMQLAGRLTGVLSPAVDLLARAEAGVELTQIEKNFLAIHYICKNPEIWEKLKTVKQKIFNGGLDTALHFLLNILIHWRLDRIFSFFVCVFLGLVEIYVSYVLLTTDNPPQWIGGDVERLLVFAAVVLSFVLPAVAFLIGEAVMYFMAVAVRSWMNEEAVRQARAAERAAVPLAKQQ